MSQRNVRNIAVAALCAGVIAGCSAEVFDLEDELQALAVGPVHLGDHAASPWIPRPARALMR